MAHTITLNIRYDCPDTDWQKIQTVYKSMPGWHEGCEVPSWFGGPEDERYITASIEPSGVLLEGQLDTGQWTGWLTLLCARLSLSLGREIHDAEV